LVINAVRYLFPPEAHACDPIRGMKIVFGWFRKLAVSFLFQTVHASMLILDRSIRAEKQGPLRRQFVSEVIRRRDQQKGFEVLPRRWGLNEPLPG
jgi:hypothetical protein